jgi:hypothetical protein
MAHNSGPNLVTFLSGPALKKGKPFPVRCNCAATITLMPPFEEEQVICPDCEASIKLLVIDGPVGYVYGRDPDGTPRLIHVQGSSSPHPDTLSPERRAELLSGAFPPNE